MRKGLTLAAVTIGLAFATGADAGKVADIMAGKAAATQPGAATRPARVAKAVPIEDTSGEVKPYAMRAKAGAPEWVQQAIDKHEEQRPGLIASFAKMVDQIGSDVRKGGSHATAARKKQLEDTRSQLRYWFDPQSIPKYRAEASSEATYHRADAAPALYGVKVIGLEGDGSAMCEVRVGGGFSGEQGTTRMTPTKTVAMTVRAVVSGRFLDGVKPGVMFNMSLIKNGEAQHKGATVPAMKQADPSEWMEPTN